MAAPPAVGPPHLRLREIMLLEYTQNGLFGGDVVGVEVVRYKSTQSSGRVLVAFLGYGKQWEQSVDERSLVTCALCLGKVDASRFFASCGDYRHALCFSCASGELRVSRSGLATLRCPTCRCVGRSEITDGRGGI